MVSTRYAVGCIITLIYDADQTATAYNNGTAATTYTGVWKIADYDANTNTISYQQRHNSGTYKAKAAVYRYQLLFQTDELTLMPLNSNSNATGTTKTMSTNEFNPFGQILYYGSTTTVAANGNIAATVLWDRYQLDLRYSLNCGSTLTAHKDVYLVAQPTSNGMVKLVSPYWTQELPAEKDKLVYIYLGHAYSAYQIELEPVHPIYYYNNGIKTWNGTVIEDEHIINENLCAASDIGMYGFMKTSDEADYWAITSNEQIVYSTTSVLGSDCVKLNESFAQELYDWRLATLTSQIQAYPNEKVTVTFKVKGNCRVYANVGNNSLSPNTNIWGSIGTDLTDTFETEPKIKVVNTTTSDYTTYSFTFTFTKDVADSSWEWEQAESQNQLTSATIQIGVRPTIANRPTDNSSSWNVGWGDGSWLTVDANYRIKHIKIERSAVASEYSLAADDLTIDNLTWLRDDYDIKTSIQALARMVETLQKNVKTLQTNVTSLQKDIKLQDTTSTLYQKIQDIESQL